MSREVNERACEEKSYLNEYVGRYSRFLSMSIATRRMVNPPLLPDYSGNISNEEPNYTSSQVIREIKDIKSQLTLEEAIDNHSI